MIPDPLLIQPARRRPYRLPSDRKPIASPLALILAAGIGILAVFALLAFVLTQQLAAL